VCVCVCGGGTKRWLEPKTASAVRTQKNVSIFTYIVLSQRRSNIALIKEYRKIKPQTTAVYKMYSGELQGL